jgi:carbonic anhydrase/acetyltransferase-like protein (isoleucine patch superfamily)
VLNRARIGRNCIVGANALVTEARSFPTDSLIVGTPAKAVRTLDAEKRRAAAAEARRITWRMRALRVGLRRIG